MGERDQIIGYLLQQCDQKNTVISSQAREIEELKRQISASQRRDEPIVPNRPQSIGMRVEEQAS